MKDALHPQSGRTPSGRHSPIYQGIIAVRCHQCSLVHKMMFSSDEREMVENHVEHTLRLLREGGYTPTAMITESYHPGTDLTMRDWQQVEALFNAQTPEDAF